MDIQIALLSVILVLTALLPLLVRKVEENLEVFLLVMGVAAALVSHALNWGRACADPL
jgi:predicted cation transporter